MGHGPSQLTHLSDGADQRVNVLKKDKKTKDTDLPSVAANEVDSASRRPRLRPLAALWPYVARHRGKLALAAIALVVSALAMLAIPLAVRRVIDMGFGTQDGVLIDRYFAVLVLIGFVLAVASAARFYYVNWLGERVVADLRSDVFRHVTELGPAFFERNHSGELMSRLTADTTQIKAMASTSLSQALRSFIMLLGALVMMFVTSVHLSLLVLLAIPLTVLPLIAVGRMVRRLSRRAQDTLAEASAYASEHLAASRTMQAFAHEKQAANQYRSAVEVSFEAARERMRARAALTALAMFLVIACIVGILWFGAAAVVDDSMSVGRLSQFVLYAVFAGASFAQVSEIWGEINQSAGAAERLTELLALQPEITSPADPVPLPVPPRGEVALDRVSFAYPGRPDLPALDNVSLSARHGENIAIVGPSGAGKSTIFNLLLRFFDPQKGAVLVDGIDVRRVDLNALRARMALVPQDVALFAGTIADNIRYGSPDASREAVERAAEAAQADAFIRALPDGYDTRLGERGITLSGGQRQRIAIARAILKDAPILLLDEATSALDTESEALVQRGLERLMAGRTTLVIAHRLSTVQKADRIVVMDKGQIVEQGTHGELIARGGLYARLAEMQFAAEAAE